ncbi:MAG: SAM-dependent methyltransferase [Bacteroides sp.]|nr:SAM-dependent methyltransferase [Bacteroides sp.]
MIFVHGGEEVHYLESHFVRVEVIPGISTANALAALTRIPLTYRGVASSVAFVSGHGEEIQVPQADTLLYYMGARNLRRIARTLLDKGLPTQRPVLLVYHVSAPDQQEFYTTVGELAVGDTTYPTPLIMLAGEVAALHRRPLEERQKVLVTGNNAQRYSWRGGGDPYPPDPYHRS